MAEEVQGDEYFEVEDIRGWRQGEEGREYLVKWAGYGHKHNTWEPAWLRTEAASNPVCHKLSRQDPGTCMEARGIGCPEPVITVGPAAGRAEGPTNKKLLWGDLAGRQQIRRLIWRRYRGAPQSTTDQKTGIHAQNTELGNVERGTGLRFLRQEAPSGEPGEQRSMKDEDKPTPSCDAAQLEALR